MRKPIQPGLYDEMIVDNFAGGGGASTGIEQAIGRPIDIAINHDPEAVAMHKANHPFTKHYCESVFDVDPREVARGRKVGLAWFSPDCKHFSKAKGGKPVEKKIRGLAWVVKKYGATVRPRIMIVENVEEFQKWGPLIPKLDDQGHKIIGKDNKPVMVPCPARVGLTFHRWVKELRKLGYNVEWKELAACDYGAPTTRKRLFLVARCDGQPIVWPKATHGPGLKPYRTAAECIDWSIPCPSIFERTRPLAENTLRRIAKGIEKFVINNADPFIVRIGHASANGNLSYSKDKPLTTITSKAEHCLVSPTLIQTGYGERPGQAPRVPGLHKPLGTVVAGGQKHALVAAFLAKHYTGVTGSELKKPIGTVTTIDHHSLVSAHLIRPFGQSIGKSPDEPAPTVMPGGAGKTGLVTSHIIKMKGNNLGHDYRQPLQTITSGGLHFGEVRAFLMKYYGTDQAPELKEPLHTITTKDRFGIVTVKGEDYMIVDIGMRMLQPRELFRAQGFPDSYIIDTEYHGKPMTKGAQVRMCGNSVSPYPAKAIIEANYVDKIQSVKEPTVFMTERQETRAAL